MSLAEPIAAGGGVLHGDKYPRRNSRSASASNLCTGATGKTGSPSQYCCASRLGTHSESATGSSRMDDRDKMIYNSLGDTSGPKGKMTFSELGLDRMWQKRGIMYKTGPDPSWYTPWRKRVFVLKDNFLYYLPANKKLKNAHILGGIYLKHAIVEKTSLPFAKTVLSITPPVPRRKGWRDDETSIFYIRFRTVEGRNEWFEELQQVSFDHKFPTKQAPIINSSMEFKYECPTKRKDRNNWTDCILNKAH